MDNITEMDAVVSKVRKLLAMAAGNANEHESASAARKAQELLEAYNLSMAVVNQASHTHTKREDERRAGGLYRWQRNIWYAVATLNFCRYSAIQGNLAGSTYEHQLIGSKANVIGSEIMADYLQTTIERLARAWVAENRPGRSIFIKDAIAYREGVANRVASRLWSLRWVRLAEDEAKIRAQRESNRKLGVDTENALVLQDVLNTEDDLNEDYIHGLEPGTTAKRRALNVVRREAAERAAAEELAKLDAWKLANPKEAALLEAKEAKEYAEWAAKHEREANKPRALSAEEKRRDLPSFREGYVAGADISLDRQIDEQRKIG